MIEVERKFVVTPSQAESLIAQAQVIGEKTFTDTYYDSADFLLTTSDKWLRSREGVFELKMRIESKEKLRAEEQQNMVYEEIIDEIQILSALKLPPTKTLTSALQKVGYEPFCVCKTTRKTYTRGIMTICFDAVEFQEFTYGLAEIEILVSKKSEVERAANDIVKFAKEKNLEIGPVRGKIIEYLKQVRPGHYQTLLKAGIVKDF